ncbi:MAG: hypothetical protein HY926_01050 [Elusimicrobia bacterium]|nr:hypothetical protein [Elusimicrobiota bacterium]
MLSVRRAPCGALAQTRENRKAIRACMKRWCVHNRYGRSIGRGLSDAELVDKVAGETGASRNLVRRSLKQDD